MEWRCLAKKEKNQLDTSKHVAALWVRWEAASDCIYCVFVCVHACTFVAVLWVQWVKGESWKRGKNVA